MTGAPLIHSQVFDEDLSRSLNRQQVGALLTARDWRFAKTMPKWPHWYIVRDNWNEALPWENVVQFLRDDGVDGWFQKKTKRKYWRFGGMRYWTMGSPLWQTKIINRDEDVPVPYLRLEGDPS